MEGFIYLVPFIILSWFGTSFFFKAAGEKQWKAFIPVYNVIVWLKLIKKPTWWVLLSFIPVVNIVLFIGMVVELLNSFGIRNKAQHVIAAVVPYIYLPYLGMKGGLAHTGPVDYSNQKKGIAREWSEALFFAIIAATAIRAFVIEAFVIPTGSMERTLRVYDCLFVNKMSYGTRFTMTPLSVPFSHQTIMGTSIKSYTDFVKIPYFRFPAFEDIDNGDMVVFNYPQEDYHPIDKRSHYIKRCIGTPGDSLAIIDGVVKVNGEDFVNADTYQLSYTVSSSVMLGEQFFELYEVAPDDRRYVPHGNTFVYDIAMPDNIAEQMKSESGITGIVKNIKPRGAGGAVFYDESKTGEWTVDNFGPIYMPQAGDVININEDNFGQYKRLINVYEHGEIIRSEDLLVQAEKIKELNQAVNSINVTELFVNANKDYRLFNGSKGSFGQLYSIVNGVKDNFIHVELPGGVLKLADQFYWKDNANYSDADMINLADDFKSFFEENYKSQLEELKSLYAQFENAGEDVFLINGEMTNKYEVKQGYFFMIGDNRHRSADSRMWGYVPENHIVGKPVFVWMSLSNTTDGNIFDRVRWNRVCSFVDRDGLSRSYKIEVLILILLWTGFNQLYWKPKKAKKKKQLN